jgi:hypothetical protein
MKENIWRPLQQFIAAAQARSEKTNFLKNGA